MPLTHFRVSDSGQQLTEALAALREQFELRDDFPAEAMADADAAMRNYQLPPVDRRDEPFITIDPPQSLDLDQAMDLKREGSGYRVLYAIADVPHFVQPGSALDAETRKRGQTIYTPDTRIPLHPTELSEGAASLLEGQDRGAYVWDIALDAAGALVSATVDRATIRSIAKLNYEQVQAEIDANTPSSYLETIQLLKEVGLKRIDQEKIRGGASLNSPEQQIDRTPDGGYSLSFRPNLPVEDWNAQISLLTGMAAARIMLQGKVGILRTMPAPDDGSINRFKLQAQTLGMPWPEGMKYGEFLRTLDPEQPKHLALLHAATSLFRGASYTAFDGELPQSQNQAAIAAPYAHTTAPLRRLVDRFVLVICQSLSNHQPVPGWARSALEELPDLMKKSDQLASTVDRAAMDLVEAAVLSQSVGQEFPAVVISVSKSDAASQNENGSKKQSASQSQAFSENVSDSKPAATGQKFSIQLQEPAVTASCQAPLGFPAISAGDSLKVRLVEADISQHRVLFEAVSRVG